ASHELRTPLTNIKLRSEALRVMDLTADQAVATRFIGEIDTEADRLGRMATTLLDLSRLEAQTTDLPAPPLDIAPLLLEMSRVIGVRMRAAALTYRARIPTQLPPICIAPADMEEILANLLDNAIKYTPAGGTVQLDAVADGARVRLVIADSGLGIPADDLPSIFDRFYRVDKARSRKAGGDSVGSGAGLGLFLVKTLVERNGGTIVAASSPGAGTTFTVHFPLAVFD
ncbi:MAG: hypothetical protein KDD78_00015, partial [Caldilineaceae bacterium]|nr:hypothetical protein [Caldilineaceae bacterium]